MPSRWLLALLILVTACNDDYCSRHTDCSANQTCSIEGKCVGATSEPVGDAGTEPLPDDGSITIDAGPDAAIDGGME
jgi:hypothetical protein